MPDQLLEPSAQGCGDGGALGGERPAGAATSPLAAVVSQLARLVADDPLSAWAADACTALVALQRAAVKESRTQPRKSHPAALPQTDAPPIAGHPTAAARAERRANDADAGARPPGQTETRLDESYQNDAVDVDVQSLVGSGRGARDRRAVDPPPWLLERWPVWKRDIARSAQAAGLLDRPTDEVGLLRRLGRYDEAQVSFAVERLVAQLAVRPCRVRSPFGVLGSAAGASDPGYFPATGTMPTWPASPPPAALDPQEESEVAPVDAVERQRILAEVRARLGRPSASAPNGP